MEKTLFITDLDGTLLNRDSRINPMSISIINELMEKGMIFTYATARSLVSAAVATQGLAVKIPVIVYNGAFIIQPDTGEILSQVKFSSDDVDKVKIILGDNNISPLVYSYIDGVEKVTWIKERENEGIRYYKKMREGDKRFNPISDVNKLYQGDMFYFTCIGDGEREELQKVYDIFSNDDRFYCTIKQEIYRPEYWFEIMPALATKANAIDTLKKMLGCTRVISFGDAVNDIPMFEISDEAYAVENAVEELKEIADGIIGSNDDDGVAKWLKEQGNC